MNNIGEFMNSFEKITAVIEFKDCLSRMKLIRNINKKYDHDVNIEI
jgi:hypothetical protein